MRHSIKLPSAIDFVALFEPFLDEYRKVGGKANRPAIHLYAAIRLLELASEAFRMRYDDWLSHARRFIDVAQHEIQKVSDSDGDVPGRLPTRPYSPAATVDDPFNTVADEGLLGEGESIDPRVARLRLREVTCIDGNNIGFELESIRVLRHKSARRCLVEYSGRSITGQGPMQIFGKAHGRAKHYKSIARQTELWNAGFDTNSADGISVARPLGVIHEWQMWLQLAVPGQLSWTALEGPQAAKFGRRVAEAAYKLHRANIEASVAHTLADELAILDDQVPRVADQLPELQPRLHDVLTMCEERAAAIDQVTPAGIHRDFYPDQVIIDGDRLYVVDHDLYALGDPRLDIGNFIGHLIERSLRVAGHPHTYNIAASAMINRFIELNSADERWGESIEVYTILTLARHISLSRRFPERWDTTRKLINLLLKLETSTAARSALVPEHFQPPATV